MKVVARVDTSDETAWANNDAADAVAVVYDRHIDRVYGHCLRQLGSVHDAQEAAASTFFEAWRRHDDVHFVDGSMLPWLLVTATFVCKNLSRARQRYDAQLARLPAAVDQPDIADEAIHTADAAVATEPVGRAFRTLSVDAQAVLTLCDIEGLGYEQAAALLGVPVGTVRSRVSRARERLRAALRPANPTGQDACPEHRDHRESR